MIGWVEPECRNSVIDRLLREQIAHQRRTARQDAPSGDEASREPLPSLRIERVVANAASAR